jgi:hypothetical protein
MKKIDWITVIGVVFLGAVLGVQFAYALLGGF